MPGLSTDGPYTPRECGLIAKGYAQGYHAGASLSKAYIHYAELEANRLRAEVERLRGERDALVAAAHDHYGLAPEREAGLGEPIPGQADILSYLDGRGQE